MPFSAKVTATKLRSILLPISGHLSLFWLDYNMAKIEAKKIEKGWLFCWFRGRFKKKNLINQKLYRKWAQRKIRGARLALISADQFALLQTNHISEMILRRNRNFKWWSILKVPMNYSLQLNQKSLWLLLHIWPQWSPMHQYWAVHFCGLATGGYFNNIRRTLGCVSVVQDETYYNEN